MLDLLTTDESNPRSLGYQTGRLMKRVADLPRKKRAGLRLSEEEGLILQLSTDLRLSHAAELGQVDPTTGRRTRLDAFLSQFTERLQRIAVVVTETYFSAGAGPQQLVTTDGDDDS